MYTNISRNDADILDRSTATFVSTNEARVCSSVAKVPAVHTAGECCPARTRARVVRHNKDSAMSECEMGVRTDGRGEESKNAKLLGTAGSYAWAI